MKIQHIHIEEYRHLKNLDFDFTYQTGEKKGQPLEKICLIGQSATGKTSVLELIKFEFKKLDSNVFSTPSSVSIKLNFKLSGQEILVDFLGSNYFDFAYPEMTGNKPSVYYLPSSIINDSSEVIFSEMPSKKNLENALLKNIKKYLESSSSVVEFNRKYAYSIYEAILNEIALYIQKVTEKGSEIINKGFMLNMVKMQVEMDKWKKENPNPVEDFAKKCLDSILNKIHLEVDVADTSEYIKIKKINNNSSLNFNQLSTGTQQIILNAIPIYKLPTDGRIIMIDEPERSLFPDMQIGLIDYYKSLAPKAQFIVATHSPFIAASFEPEERFILYFDENGDVAVRNGVAPIGDDPNDILKSDFGIDSLMNEHGVKAYKHYLSLKSKMKSESDDTKKKELLNELVELGDKYKF